MDKKTFSLDAVTQNCTVTANFLIDIHKLNVKYQGHGTVKGNGINASADCTEDYNYGTIVVLAAKEAAGYEFSNWINCDQPSRNQCTMTIDNDDTCTAVFTRGGYVSGDGNINLAASIMVLKIISGKPLDNQTILYLDINNDAKTGLIEGINILQDVYKK